MKHLNRINVGEFLKDLLSKSDSTSHKRLIALGAFVVLVSMVIIKAIGCAVDSNLIYVFAALTGGQSILTVVDKYNKKSED